MTKVSEERVNSERVEGVEKVKKVKKGGKRWKRVKKVVVMKRVKKKKSNSVRVLFEEWGGEKIPEFGKILDQSERGKERKRGNKLRSNRMRGRWEKREEKMMEHGFRYFFWGKEKSD